MDGTGDGEVVIGGAETAETIEGKIIGERTNAREPSSEEFAGILRLAEDEIAKAQKKRVEGISKHLVDIINDFLKKESIPEEERKAAIKKFDPAITEYVEKLIEASEKEVQLVSKLENYVQKDVGISIKEMIHGVDLGPWFPESFRDYLAKEAASTKGSPKQKTQ